MKKKYLKITVLTLAMMCISLQSFSFQTTKSPPPPQNTTRGPGIPPPGLPIDGLLTYLLIGGSVFGIRQLRKKED
jgi:hypothetical protein